MTFYNKIQDFKDIDARGNGLSGQICSPSDGIFIVLCYFGDNGKRCYSSPCYLLLLLSSFYLFPFSFYFVQICCHFPSTLSQLIGKIISRAQGPSELYLWEELTFPGVMQRGLGRDGVTVQAQSPPLGKNGLQLNYSVGRCISRCLCQYISQLWHPQ